MSDPREKKRLYRLVWVMDLVSDSHKCYVTLVFQNANSKRLLFDKIPPELLSYCTVGSYYSEGRMWKNRPSDGSSLTFTITSDEHNKFVPANNIFSDHEYNLSLSDQKPIYSDVCKRQLCFVQQSGDTKIVIPCFVLASAYYFKSTSMREAVLSRKMESLFEKCTLDPTTRHAEIYLKSAGNVGDAN